MSFHPAMPYGTDEWHRSQRATLQEGPEFAYTPENRKLVWGDLRLVLERLEREA